VEAMSRMAMERPELVHTPIGPARATPLMEAAAMGKVQVIC
jgi:hypothetical protein